MAEKFLITAELQIRGPANLAEAKRRITRGLRDVDIDVNITGASKAKRDVDNVRAATDRAEKSAGKLGRTISISLQRFATYSLVTRAVGILTTGLGGAVDAAIQFEREMVKISQVSGKSITQLSGLSNEIRRLATDLGVASESLVGVTRILTQAGLSADETKVALEALAKSELAPTFDNMTQTAEGAVAIFNQFREGAGALEAQLGSINAVAGKFAVESGDLIAAVRRVGGVFKASGGDLNELLALFTSIRATTRESGESIATGLRTIFVRIQRPRTLKFLEQMGVSLTDLEGKFVGPFEAVKRMNAAFKDLAKGDPRFIKIAEEIAGFRQIGKVIPLLQQFEIAQKALNVAKEGTNSLDEDAQTAQQALAVRIVKVKEEFLSLVDAIYRSPVFQTLANTSLNLASSLNSVAMALKDIIPLLGVFASIKIAKGVAGFLGGLGRGRSRAGAPTRNFEDGGLSGSISRSDGVPFKTPGTSDDTLAHVRSGEFVVKRSSAAKIGLGRLNYMNKSGELPSFENGGVVGKQAMIQDSFNRENGRIVSDVPEAQAVMDNFIDELKKFGRMFQGIKKAGVSPLSKSDAKEYDGLAYEDGSIGVALGRATDQDVRHETGHQIDRTIGDKAPGYNGFTEPFASKQEGTFQNAITEKLKPILKKQLQKEGASLDEIEYRLRNEEIFADLMAKTTPKARAILVHTTSAEKGLKTLSALLNQQPDAPGFAGLTSKKVGTLPRKKAFKQASYFYSGTSFVDKHGGPRGGDTVPVYLNPNEAVLTPGAADFLGRGNIEQLNKRAKYFASGTGRVSGAARNTRIAQNLEANSQDSGIEESAQKSVFAMDAFSGRMLALSGVFTVISSTLNSIAEPGTKLADKLDAIQQVIFTVGSSLLIYNQIVKKASEAGQKVSDKRAEKQEVIDNDAAIAGDKARKDRAFAEARKKQVEAKKSESDSLKDDFNKGQSSDLKRRTARLQIEGRIREEKNKGRISPERQKADAEVAQKESDFQSAASAKKDFVDKQKRLAQLANKTVLSDDEKDEAKNLRSQGVGDIKKKRQLEAEVKRTTTDLDNAKVARDATPASGTADQKLIDKLEREKAKLEQKIRTQEEVQNRRKQKINELDESIRSDEGGASQAAERARNSTERSQRRDRRRTRRGRFADNVGIRARRARGRFGRVGRRLTTRPTLRGTGAALGRGVTGGVGKIAGAAKGLVGKMGGLTGVLGVASGAIIAFTQATAAVANYMQKQYLKEAEKNLEAGDYDDYRSNSAKANEAGRAASVANAAGSGALTGAGIGATLGLFAGPVGAAVGGAVGAALGATGAGLYAASGQGGPDYEGQIATEGAIVEDALKKMGESLGEFDKKMINSTQLVEKLNNLNSEYLVSQSKKQAAELGQAVKEAQEQGLGGKIGDAVSTALSFSPLALIGSGISNVAEKGLGKATSDATTSTLDGISSFNTALGTDEFFENLIAKRVRGLAPEGSFLQGFKSQSVIEKEQKRDEETRKSVSFKDSDAAQIDATFAEYQGNVSNQLNKLFEKSTDIGELQKQAATLTDPKALEKFKTDRLAGVRATLTERGVDESLIEKRISDETAKFEESLPEAIKATKELATVLITQKQRAQELISIQNKSIVALSAFAGASVEISNTLGLASGKISQFEANLETIKLSSSNAGFSAEANKAITSNVAQIKKTFNLGSSDAAAQTLDSNAGRLKEINVNRDKVLASLSRIDIKKNSDPAAQIGNIIKELDIQVTNTDGTVNQDGTRLLATVSSALEAQADKNGGVSQEGVTTAIQGALKKEAGIVAELTKTLTEASKLQQQYSAFVLDSLRERIGLENELASARLSGVDLQKEAAQIIESAGGRKAKSGESFALDKQNILNREAGISELNSSADISGNIQETKKALEASRSKLASGALDGDQVGIQEEKEKISDLTKAMGQQASTIRDSIKSRQEELELIGKKNKLEKDSFDSLIKGDIADFFKKQSAIGATAAAASGDDRLIGLFGATAIGEALSSVQEQKDSGVKSLFGQDISSIQEQLFSSGLERRGFSEADARAGAKVAAGSTEQEERIKQEQRGLGKTLGELGEAQVSDAKFAVKSATISTERLDIKFKDSVKSSQDKVESTGARLTEVRVAEEAKKAAEKKAKEELETKKESVFADGSTDKKTVTTEKTLAEEARSIPDNTKSTEVKDLQVSTNAVYLNGIDIRSISTAAKSSSEIVDTNKPSSFKTVDSAKSFGSNATSLISNYAAPVSGFVDKNASQAIDLASQVVFGSSQEEAKTIKESSSTSTSSSVDSGVPSGVQSSTNSDVSTRSYFSDADVKNFSIFLEATQKLSAAVEKLASSQISVQVNPVTVTLNVTGPDLLDYVTKAARSAVADQVREQIANRDSQPF